MTQCLSRLMVTCAMLLCAATSAPAGLPVGFADVPVNATWQQPVGLTFAPDGRMVVWEKAGRVWIVEGGVKLTTPLIDISEEVGDWRDFGLLGFALDPNYLQNGRFYLMYVVDYHHLAYFGTPQYDPGANQYMRDTIVRITRYTGNASDGFRTADHASRVVLVGESASTGFPVLHQSHGPGSLVFGHDGSLLASCGDGASFQVADHGGPIAGSSNTALADAIITPQQDVGAYRAQQVDSLSGKVIRIDPQTGDGLPGNPWFDPGAPRSPSSRVWTLGLRNPFRFTVRPGAGHHHVTRHNEVGTLYIGDNGWNQWESLFIVPAAGSNCGWPLFEGHDPQPLYQAQGTLNPFAPNPLAGGACPPSVPFRDLCIQDTLSPSFPNPCNTAQQLPATLDLFVHHRPAIDWGHDGGPARLPVFVSDDAGTVNLGSPGATVTGASFGGNSSIGGAWYPDQGAYPALYRGGYFHADYVAGWIKLMTFGPGDELLDVRDFATAGTFSGIVSMALNPADSLLYFIQFDFGGGATVRKITYSSNLPPTSSSSTVGLNYGPSPLQVQFSSAGSSDPENQPLQYEWDFGDGSPASPLPNPSHIFTAPGPGPARFDVTLTVTDSGGLQASASLVVSPNNTPPVLTITSPADGALFPPGDSTLIPMTADIADAEHAPGEIECRWQVLLHHNTHVHPEPPDPSCDTSAVVSGAHGANSEVFYFEFIDTVTDAHGLSASASVNIYPDLPACTGDINRDGRTDTADLVILLLYFGTTGTFGTPGDLDYNSNVNTTDLVLMLSRFGCGT